MNKLEWKQQVVSLRMEDAMGIKGLWTAKINLFVLKILKLEEANSFIYMVHALNRYSGKNPAVVSATTMKDAKKKALLVLREMIENAQELLLEEQKRVILEGESLIQLKASLA